MRFNRNGLNRQLITHLHPKSPVSEAYRTVRTNIHFSNPGLDLKSILVTSAGPEEGKSTTLANVAVTMAQAGKKVLIIDADLRKPVQHKIFEVPNGRGTTSVLVGDFALEEAVQATAVAGLDLLTSGPIPPNPSELLDSAAMKKLLTESKEKYDMVMIDSPPAMAVTDALILCSLVDGVILVVKSGFTRIEIIKDTKELLEKAQARFLGVILNEVKYSGDDYRYYYYYGSHKKEDLEGESDEAGA